MEVLFQVIFVVVVVGALYFMAQTIRTEKFGNFLEREIEKSHRTRMREIDESAAFQDANKLVTILHRHPFMDVEATFENLENSRIWDWNFGKMIVYKDEDFSELHENID